MSSKFAQFLENNKIDRRRILAVSRRLERLVPEDRALRLSRRKAKGAAGGGAAAAEGEKAPAKKPHSGRPVTPRLLDAAAAGKPISGPAKTRLLRALNHILEQKKQEKVDLRALF